MVRLEGRVKISLSEFILHSTRIGQFFNTRNEDAPVAILHRKPYSHSQVTADLVHESGFVKILELKSETIPVGHAFRFSGAMRLNLNPNLVAIAPKRIIGKSDQLPKLTFTGVNFVMYVDEQNCAAAIMTEANVMIDVAKAS